MLDMARCGTKIPLEQARSLVQTQCSCKSIVALPSAVIALDRAPLEAPKRTFIHCKSNPPNSKGFNKRFLLQKNMFVRVNVYIYRFKKMFFLEFNNFVQQVFFLCYNVNTTLHNKIKYCATQTHADKFESRWFSCVS